MVIWYIPTQVRSANLPNNATFFMCTTIQWINGISWISVTAPTANTTPSLPLFRKIGNTAPKEKKPESRQTSNAPSPKKKQYSFSLSPEPRYASSQLGGLLAQKMTKGSCACLHAWFRVIKVLRHTGAKCPVWSLLSSKLYVHKYALPLPSDPASVTLTCDSTLQIAKQD